MSGLNRVEYTVGVKGCDRRATYVVLCQEGTDTCFAANPEGHSRSQNLARRSKDQNAARLPMAYGASLST